MYLEDKQVLVMGLGKSGLSSILALHRYGANITIADNKNKLELKDTLKSIDDIDLQMKLGGEEINLENIDLIVKSPGIPPRDKTLVKAKEMGIEIINDIELGYRLCNSNNIIGITGTNGKTTTTTLVGNILEAAGLKPHIAGNIGVGFLEKIFHSNEGDYFVLELSSFQLEHTNTFKLKIALILNISPDHLDWHESYENYIASKKKIFQNMNKDDFIVLNYDDPLLRSFKDEINSKIIWFSQNSTLNVGVYLKNGYIIYNDGLEEKQILKIEDLKVIGKHNLENVLGAIGVALALGIDIDIIERESIGFNSVEHRLEFTDEIKGIKFYNDSKGTNPNASIKAIQAIDGPIILIAGGYEKNADFEELMINIKKRVKCLILIGDTKKRIRDLALKKGYDKLKLVDDMKQAVTMAYNKAEKGDNILLSPACASWDMYESFEDRGRDFKMQVHALGDGNIEEN